MKKNNRVNITLNEVLLDLIEIFICIGQFLLLVYKELPTNLNYKGYLY
jgi:hypothetical protein